MYFILENLPQNQELDMAPSEYWILNCFFIIIKYEGDLYLPLTYPIYKVNNKTGYIEGGVWTPPYAAYRIDSSIMRYRTPEKILNVIDEFLKNNQRTLDEHVDYFFYHLGVHDYKLKKIHSFTEYKNSFSEEYKVKCYHVLNYLVTSLDITGIVNIADPECMRNMHYLNLNINLQNLPHRENNLFPTYNGKQIVSNLYETLNQKRNIFFKEEAHNILSHKYLEHNYNGIIFSYDLNSSGLIRENIEDGFMSLNQNGEALSEMFLSKMLMVFTEVLLLFNINQYRLEGDGFIAAIPCQDYEIHGLSYDHSYVKCIMTITKECDRRIKDVLCATYFEVSSKTAIVNGNYKYGKIGSLNSKTPTFSGKDMVLLARLRRGLEEWAKASGNKRSVIGIMKGSGIKKDNDLMLLDSISTEIKEKKIEVEVYG